MEEDNSEPVRFRATLEWTFPDADPWDARSYGTLLDAVKQALESAPAVNCKDVIIREAMRVGPNDDINAARGIQTKFDWSLLSPHCGHVLGTVYPVPPVNPDELEKVWELTSKAERGELKNSNILIAIGQALKPQSDAPATVARAYILTALQKAHAFREPPSPEIFERAATIPIERPVQNEPSSLPWRVNSNFDSSLPGMSICFVRLESRISPAARAGSRAKPTRSPPPRPMAA